MASPSLMVGYWKAKDAANKVFINKYRSRLLMARLQNLIHHVETLNTSTTASMSSSTISSISQCMNEVHGFLIQFSKSKFRWERLFSIEDSNTFDKLTIRLKELLVLLETEGHGLVDKDDTLSRDISDGVAEEEESILSDAATSKHLVLAAKLSIDATEYTTITSNAARFAQHFTSNPRISPHLSELNDLGPLTDHHHYHHGHIGSASTSTSDIDDDKNALIQVGEALRITKGHAPISWDSSRPLSEWYGVFAQNESRVISLSLWAAGLAGSLPPCIGQLTMITSLWLPSNSITGSIPTEIGKLLQLTALDLSDNRFSGKFKELSCCQTISLEYYIGPLPTSLYNLTKLAYLDLSTNVLTGSLESGLGNLSNLTKLDVRGNTFYGPIPSEIGKLLKLADLDLSGNNFSGAIPIELRNLTELSRLKLQGDQLFTVGKNIGTNHALSSHHHHARHKHRLHHGSRW